jgi:putative thioredoxin
MAVYDVTEADFQQRVVERSREIPVVVDFWAEWCGPCRALTPALEKAARDREGKVDLAKVDTDANQGLARSFGIQGIPAVKAFKDGQVVEEFVGAQPPVMVERFFEGLIPSEAETLAAVGDEESLRKALELEPGRADAAVPLARMLHERGETDEALAILEPVRESFQADGLAAHLRLEKAGDPTVAEALRALDSGDRERGLDLLLDTLQQADGSRDDIRALVVGELDAMGVEDPAAREYRRRLAAALY